jgi:AraC-like DNA-binding protein
MTFILTPQTDNELWDEAEQYTPPQYDLEAGIKMRTMPKQLGKGHELCIELYPECQLDIWYHEYCDEIRFNQPEEEFPLIKFSVALSGIAVDSQGTVFDSQHVTISGKGAYRSNSGIISDTQPSLCIELAMSPECLTALFPDQNGALPTKLSFLVKENEWQTPVFSRANSAIHYIARQMVYCPYEGAAKRLYLQAKSHELVGLVLAPIVAGQDQPKLLSRMKPDTIARVYAARDILRLRLEHPPSSLELARQVGLSDRTLRRGFQELFGTTMFGYLTQQRMLQAEQWLRDGKLTVAEVANRVGYAHLGCFATAFKHQFGISPRECGRRRKGTSD